MSLRAVLLKCLAILGTVLIGIWLFARAGLWGPVVIVTLMITAVVASSIPSAPIALAAGAALGHVWGTVQIVIGTEFGALIAFGLARILGHDDLRRRFGDRVNAGPAGHADRTDGDGLRQPPDALCVLRHDQLRGGAQPPARLAFRPRDTGRRCPGKLPARGFRRRGRKRRPWSCYKGCVRPRARDGGAVALYGHPQKSRTSRP